jgi:hypothetical protein
MASPLDSVIAVPLELWILARSAQPGVEIDGPVALWRLSLTHGLGEPGLELVDVPEPPAGIRDVTSAMEGCRTTHKDSSPA